MGYRGISKVVNIGGTVDYFFENPSEKMPKEKVKKLRKIFDKIESINRVNLSKTPNPDAVIESIRVFYYEARDTFKDYEIDCRMKEHDDDYFVIYIHRGLK